MDRKNRAKVFDHLYMEQGRMGDPCTYCGQPSDTYDHVPPLHLVERMSEREKINNILKKFPACRECNSCLGGLILNTLKERRRRVKQYLRKKYYKFLKMPKWDEDELQELEPKMAEDIRRASRFAEFIKQRVGFY